MKGRHFDADTVHWFCRPGWGGCAIACVWTGHHRGGGAGWGCPPVLLLHHGLPGPATAQRDPTGHKCTHRHQQGKCTNSKSCIILITVILMANINGQPYLHNPLDNFKSAEMMFSANL